jgi:hypothetical protein
LSCTTVTGPTPAGTPTKKNDLLAAPLERLPGTGMNPTERPNRAQGAGPPVPVALLRKWQGAIETRAAGVKMNNAILGSNIE